MKKSSYTESQIVKILKEVEGGRLVKEVCREYSISDATYYNWKAKYGGMEASDIKRLKDFEDKNRRLKSMFAELSLEHRILLKKSCKTSCTTRACRLRLSGAWSKFTLSLSGDWHQRLSVPVQTRCPS